VSVPDFIVILFEYLAVGLGMAGGEFLIKMGYVHYLNRFGPQEPEDDPPEDEEEEEVKKKKRRRRASGPSRWTSHAGSPVAVPAEPRRRVLRFLVAGIRR